MEENLWVKGSLELLKHGFEHIAEGKGFDLRVAMISLDNAVELAIKTFLTKNRRALNLSREDFNKAKKNFINLLDALSDYAPHKISEGVLDAIEHYHKIRNNLYHDGIGISVEKKYAEIYSVLTVNLIDKLFDIDVQRIFKEKEEIILYGKYGEFTVSWINIEYKLKELSKNVVEIESTPSTFNELISIITENNILSKALITRLLFLNHSKNLIIHQEKDFTIDEIERNIELANEIYNELLLIDV